MINSFSSYYSPINFHLAHTREEKVCEKQNNQTPRLLYQSQERRRRLPQALDDSEAQIQNHDSGHVVIGDEKGQFHCEENVQVLEYEAAQRKSS